MSDETQAKLNLAFEKVEAGNLDEAVALLKPVLDADPDNADAWWIYTHAVSDPQDARRALQNVLRLSPDYPGAADVLAVLDADFPAPSAPPMSEAERPKIKRLSATPPPPPPSFPEAGTSEAVLTGAPKNTISFTPVAVESAGTLNSEPDDLFDGEDEALESEEPGRSSLTTIIVFAVVVAAIVIALVLINPGQPASEGEGTPPAVALDATGSSFSSQAGTAVGTSTTEQAAEAPLVVSTLPVIVTTGAQPTDVQALATQEAVIEIATVETAVPEGTDELVPAVATEAATVEAELAEITAPVSLDTFDLAEPLLSDEETLAGRTLIVTICSTPGPALRTTLPQAVEAFAQSVNELPEAADAIGVRLISCADGNVLVAVAVAREQAAQFAAGTISSADFSRTWASIR